MNKVVRDHYPASKLPEDVRAEIGDAEEVRLTVEPVEEPPQSLTEILEWAKRLRAEGKIKTISTQEAVERVRALRDEWDR